MGLLENGENLLLGHIRFTGHILVSVLILRRAQSATLCSFSEGQAPRKWIVQVELAVFPHE